MIIFQAKKVIKNPVFGEDLDSAHLLSVTSAADPTATVDVVLAEDNAITTVSVEQIALLYPLVKKVIGASGVTETELFIAK